MVFSKPYNPRVTVDHGFVLSLLRVLLVFFFFFFLLRFLEKKFSVVCFGFLLNPAVLSNFPAMSSLAATAAAFFFWLRPETEQSTFSASANGAATRVSVS